MSEEGLVVQLPVGYTLSPTEPILVKQGKDVLYNMEQIEKRQFSAYERYHMLKLVPSQMRSMSDRGTCCSVCEGSNCIIFGCDCPCQFDDDLDTLSVKDSEPDIQSSNDDDSSGLSDEEV